MQYSDGQTYVICSINPVTKELGIKTSPRRCPLRQGVIKHDWIPNCVSNGMAMAVLCV